MNPAVLLYIGPIVALIGLLFCLPNQGRAVRVLGTLIGAAGLGVTSFGMARFFGLPTAPMVTVPFIILAAWCGGRMITHPAPVYSALYFGGVVLATSVLVLLMGATFLAAILVIVYAGAILVAYVFVIMLAQRAKPAEYDINVRQPTLAVTVGAALIVAVILATVPTTPGAVNNPQIPAPPAVMVPSPEGNVVDLGTVLFGEYPVTIEVAGAFLLIAMVGAIVLAGLRIGQNGSAENTRQPEKQAADVGHVADGVGV